MPTAPRYSFDNVELIPAERQLLIDGRPQPVGARAFQVLLTLLVHRHRVVTKDELLDAVWPNLVVEQNNVAVQIATLRKLLGPATLSTIPGRGYKYSGGTVRTSHAPPDPDATPPAAAPARSDRLRRSSAVPLVGRSAEVRRLGELLATHRAVTLTGPGGVGKTCLAQRLVRDMAHRFPQGTVWIDLCPSDTPVTLARTIARTLGLDLRKDDPFDSLLQALQTKLVLVTIDHVEVAPGAVARLVQAVMLRAPGVSFLLSGQARLGLRDEQVLRLTGLPVPSGHTTVPEAQAHGAVALFVARARAMDDQFVLDDRNLDQVVALCRHVDGIPLAVDEAATARADAGPPAAASGGAPCAGPRTMRQTLDRSHALLAPRERQLLRQLSVFDQAFSLENALDVVAGGDGLDTWAVLDALTDLVDRSLVNVSPGEPPRYQLLAVTRRYAAEQLQLAGEADGCCHRHAIAMARRPDGAVTAPASTRSDRRSADDPFLQSA